MLKKLILKNFKTFKSETLIDFEATKFKGIAEDNVCDGIVKGGVILGSNGVGKSTILEAIGLLLKLLLSDIKTELSYFVCMFGENDKSTLKYEFSINKDLITYSFTFNKENIILEENLLVNGKAFLTRNLKHAVINNKNEKIKYDAENYDNSTLFLRKYYFATKFTNSKTLRDWMQFLENSTYFNAFNRISIIYNHNKKATTDFYKESENIEYANKMLFDNGFLTKIKCEVTTDNKKLISMKKGNLDCWIPLELESEGNYTLLNMLPILKHAVSANGIFLFDEFSSGFSNELEEFIISFLMKNIDHSQAFFVTHSTNVLKSTIIRPDQIYNIVFSDADGASIVRASSESPRETQNYEKMYLGGVFGKRTKYGKGNN